MKNCLFLFLFVFGLCLFTSEGSANDQTENGLQQCDIDNLVCVDVLLNAETSNETCFIAWTVEPLFIGSYPARSAVSVLEDENRYKQVTKQTNDKYKFSRRTGISK